MRYQRSTKKKPRIAVIDSVDGGQTVALRFENYARGNRLLDSIERGGDWCWWERGRAGAQ